MENNKSQIEIEQREPKRGSGSLLAAARKQQNRTVEEIADELNLSATQIRSIELDQTEGLPEPTYVRGYIRSYAKLLGLDPSEVLEHYLNPNWQRGSSLDEMPRGLDHREDRPRITFSPLKFGALVIALAIIGFLLFSGQLNGLLGLDQSSSGQAPDQLSETARQADRESNNTADELDPSSPQSDSEDGETGSAESDEELPLSTDNGSADELQNTSNENELILTFSDTSWVDVRNAEGERLAYKSFAEGETLQLSSVSPMSVFIGNASAVSAAVNGSEFDLAPYREGVFARFSVPQE